VLCDRRPATPRSLCCPGCPRRLGEALEELLDGYLRLSPAPVKGGGQGGGRAPGFGSRSPARDDVLALTDRRGYADPDQPGALIGVPVVLRTWRERVREAGYGDLDPDAVQELAAWWELPDLAAAIRGSLAHVRRALGEAEQTVPVGACPLLPAELLDPDELADLTPVELATPCGGEVRARAFGADARCARCSTSWRGEDELRALGGRLGDAWMDLPALARYLDVKPGTLRQWARRDRWEREPGRTGGRALFRLVDARASWWRAYDRANPVHGPHRADWEEATIGPLLGPHRADWEAQLDDERMTA
jgi:hypothetical protein